MAMREKCYFLLHSGKQLTGKYKWIGKDHTVMGKGVLSEEGQLTAVSNRLTTRPHLEYQVATKTIKSLTL